MTTFDPKIYISAARRVHPREHVLSRRASRYAGWLSPRGGQSLADSLQQGPRLMRAADNMRGGPGGLRKIKRAVRQTLRRIA